MEVRVEPTGRIFIFNIVYLSMTDLNKINMQRGFFGLKLITKAEIKTVKNKREKSS